MEVDAFLADSAEAVQGKIYALGIGWNSIYAAAFPTQHPRLSIGLTIRVPYTATNQMHRLTVRLETSDGERVRIGQQAAGPGQELRPVYEFGGEFNGVRLFWSDYAAAGMTRSA